MADPTEVLFKRAKKLQEAQLGAPTPVRSPQVPMGAPGMAGGGMGGGAGARPSPAAPGVSTAPIVPTGAPAAPAAAPAPAGGAAPAGGPEKPGAGAQNREQQVRQAVQALHALIVEMAKSIYQVQLTDDVVKELATKMIHQLSEAMNDVTVERVKDIASDLLVEVGGKGGKKT